MCILQSSFIFDVRNRYWLMQHPWLLRVLDQEAISLCFYPRQCKGFKRNTGESFCRVAFRRNEGEGRIHRFSVTSRTEKCFWVEGGPEHLSQVWHKSYLQRTSGQFWRVKNFTCETDTKEQRKEDNKKCVCVLGLMQRRGEIVLANLNRNAFQLPELVFFKVGQSAPF